MAKTKLSELKNQIIQACLDMNASGINQGTSGNISARTDDGFVITASGIPYDRMTEDHVVEMDLEGGYRGDFMPSSEWRMHSDIYNARAEAQVVLHAHSPYATALSSLREDIPAFHYLIGVAGGNSLRCSEYATFGTQELSDSMLEAMKDRTACLLANHGVICFASSIRSAMALGVELESLCRQYSFARQLGDPVILDDAEMATVVERMKTYGKDPSEFAGTNAPAVYAPVRRD